jgi:hypothetical protein
MKFQKVINSCGVLEYPWNTVYPLTIDGCCSLFLKEHPLMTKQVTYKHFSNVILQAPT